MKIFFVYPVYFADDCETLIFIVTNKSVFHQFLWYNYYYFQVDPASIYYVLKRLERTKWGLIKVFIYCCKSQRYNINYTIKMLSQSRINQLLVFRLTIPGMGKSLFLDLTVFNKSFQLYIGWTETIVIVLFIAEYSASG